MKKTIVICMVLISALFSSLSFSIKKEDIKPYVSLEALVDAAHKCVGHTLQELYDYTQALKSFVERAIYEGEITGKMVAEFKADIATGAFKDWIRNTLLPHIRKPELSDNESDEVESAELAEARAKYNFYHKKLKEGEGSKPVLHKKVEKWLRKVQELEEKKG